MALSVQSLSAHTDLPLPSTSKPSTTKIPASSTYTRDSSDTDQENFHYHQTPPTPSPPVSPPKQKKTMTTSPHELYSVQSRSAHTDQPLPSTSIPSIPSTSTKKQAASSTYTRRSSDTDQDDFINTQTLPTPSQQVSHHKQKKTTSPQKIADKEQQQQQQQQEEDESEWTLSQINKDRQVHGAGLIRFSKHLKMVDPEGTWPKEYVREKRILLGINLSSRNKFSTHQLQIAFLYLGAYRGQYVPADLVRRLRTQYQEFDNAFKRISNKTIIDKMRSWPKDEHLILSPP